MFGVGRIGSYISRGVYSVSGPFQPFGGAVDIVVVEQPDGTFKSSPWYVRFGKFQGVLTDNEKVVSINVNGIDAEWNMILDHRGEAFFIREVQSVEGEVDLYASDGEVMEVKSDDQWHTQKSRSCNFDSIGKDLVSEIDASNGKILGRNGSNNRRRRVFGLPFGRRSMKANSFKGGEGADEVGQVSSMERAEMAADLLEVRWTTNLRVGASQSPRAADVSNVNNNGSLTIGDGQKTESSVLDERAVTKPGNYMEVYTLEETYMRVELPSGASVFSAGTDNECMGGKKDGQSESSENFKSNANLSPEVDDQEIEVDVLGHRNSSNAPSSPEHLNSTSILNGGSITELDGGVDRAEPSILQDSEGELSLGNTNDCHLAGEAGTTPVCNISHELAVDIDRKDNVTEGSSSSTESNLGNPSEGDVFHVRNPSGTIPDNSEEEQFSFSDLDDQKVNKDKQTEASSLGSEDCQIQDSPGSSEDEVTEKNVAHDKSFPSTGKSPQGDLLTDGRSPKVNSSSVSSPIFIPKLQNNNDEQALTPVADSLPNMSLSGHDINSCGVPDLLGRSLDSNLKAIKVANEVLVASELEEAQQQAENLQLMTDSSQDLDEIKKIFSDPAVELSICRHLLYEGMGYEAAALAFDAEKLDLAKFPSLGLDILKDDRLVVRIGGLYFPWDAALPIALAIGSGGNERILEPKGMIAVGQNDGKTLGDTQKSINSRSGSWKIWPFSRSNSMQGQRLNSETDSESAVERDKKMDVTGSKVSKKRIRAKLPTSEQLASLNLNDGKNEVTFTFSTARFGKQQVEARIFLWKWNTRIVISDVDGTITKSDVLGQFMPLMGIDWSQTGVTHLFSAIKENGYQLLFLSARSILQSYQTRQFLYNLKQDGKELPEGPVLISPDGLFPSLYREVIRRAPHEFKISCLEDIKALFPSDHHPFYAGFGNRDTDEISYLKVGIPLGKIFIINPKGQIAVNRRVDTKSYSCLHALVHGMFPPAPAAEQVQCRRKELRSKAKIVPISLDQVYMLKVEGIAFRFLPDPVQIKNALELKASEAKSGFDGVPVFQSDLLVVKKKNKRYCPIYFRKEDIERELYQKASRTRGLSQHIAVGSLEDVLKKMEISEKNSGWDDFIFVPPGKSQSQHLQEVAKG